MYVPLGAESDIEGGERVEHPGEGGGAEELLLRLEEVLSAALHQTICFIRKNPLKYTI